MIGPYTKASGWETLLSASILTTVLMFTTGLDSEPDKARLAVGLVTTFAGSLIAMRCANAAGVAIARRMGQLKDDSDDPDGRSR